MEQRIPKRTLGFIVAGFVLVIAVVVAAMFYTRHIALHDLQTADAQIAWEAWREKASEQHGTHGPVQRSVPRSGEPPALVLMRDYFAATTVGLLLPVSALYAFIAWVACGVAYQTPNRQDNLQ